MEPHHDIASLTQQGQKEPWLNFYNKFNELGNNT